MPKISKIFILIISELLFLFLLIIVLPTILIRERPGIAQTSYTETLSLDNENSFSQEFISDKNNLRSVSILLKNPVLANKSQITIAIQDANKNTIRTLNTSGISVGDPSWIDFEFPYINSQKGDKFFIKVSTDNQKKDTLYVYGNHKDKNINFRTTFTSKNIKESFNDNFEHQSTNFKSRNIFQSIGYLILLVLVNIIYLI